jgi:thioredoxin 1
MATPLFVGSNNFEQEVLKAEKPVMVDFFAPSCLECRRLEPVVHQMAVAFHDQAKIAFLNVAEAPEIAEEYHIMASPTLVFFKDGQPVDTLIGYQDSAHLTAHLQHVLQA